MLGPACARCVRQLSLPRAQARKKYCHLCEVAVKREQRERAHRLYVAKTYGIQPEDYDRLYAQQGGRCFICQRATGRTKRLAVDHDHATGLVRGLLCKQCNWLLGHARDNPAMILRAVEYLLNPPAKEVIYGGIQEAQATPDR